MALTFDDTQSAVILALLGLPPDTSDPELIIGTIRDLALDEQQEQDQPGGDPGDMAPPSAIAAAANRAGFELVDNDTHNALLRDAAEGRRVVDAARQADLEAKVNAAVDRGAITAARAKHWIWLLAADPGMAEVLAAVPDETAVSLRELGHASAKSDTQSNDIADASEWFYPTP
jgi:hypothetical protein